MGAEAFAIIGLFISLTNILSIIDMGISPTLNRELASCSIKNDLERMRDILRSLEFVFFPLVSGISLLIFSVSSYIAAHWLNGNILPVGTIEESIKIMAFVIALHFFINFYSAGVAGLQRQVFLNIVNITMVTIRYVGVIPIMFYFSPSPVVFFLWQLVISAAHLLFIRGALWKILYIPQHKVVPQTTILRDVWKFSLGVSLINFLGVITMNMDKILLSKILSLEDFGYYSVASIIAMSLAPRLASPFFTAFYPRLTQYVIQQNKEMVASLYHQGSLFVAIAIVPATVFIAFFSHDLLFIWTGSLLTAEYTHTALCLLSVGCFFNAIMYIPYALQLAHGITKISIYANAFSLIIIIPLMIISYHFFGINGVACSWLIVNSFSTLISSSIMHNILLKGEGLRWILYDNSFVIFLVFGATIILKNLMNIQNLGQLIFIVIFLYLVPIISMPTPRNIVIDFLNGTFNYYA